MNKLLKFLPVSMAFAPTFAFAQESPLARMIDQFSALLGSILPVLVSLGVIFFVWGVVQYVIADSEEAKTKGRDRIIFGIIGLTVIISIWGLVFMLADTFGTGRGVGAPDNVNNLVSQSTLGSGCVRAPMIQGLLQYFTCIIGGSVIPFLFALAVVAFIWGAIKFFILEADEEAKRTQGKQFMIWGLIALAVMISIWGLVGILADTFNFNATVLPQVKP